MMKQSAVLSAARKAGLLSAIFLSCAAGAAFAQLRPKAVFTMTNAGGGNAVLAFRDIQGSLALVQTASTGGMGTNAGLGTQGALALSADESWLLAVNAGSNDITVFAVTPSGLVWKSKAPSGGNMPVSLAVHDDRVFVVNAGGTPNIAGFRLINDGTLQPIPQSVIPLTGSAPAEIAFSNGGDMLVVTEKTSNSIAVFLAEDGQVSGPLDQPSHGATPFGFAFDKRDHLLVTEAAGGPSGTSAVSSYDIADNGMLQVISGSAGTTQASACWIAITRNGRYAYTANTRAGTLSSFTIARDGSLGLLHGVAANNGANSLPGDLALSKDSRILYSLNPGLGEILAFRLNADGSLASAGSVSGVPASAAGLVAH